MTEAFQPVRLRRQQLKQTIVAISKAFLHDPFLKYLAPDDTHRARLTPGFVSVAIKYCYYYGEVWTSPEAEGAACWLAPGQTSPSLVGMLRTGALTTPFKFGKAGFARFNEVIAYTDTLHKQYAPMPHWYLWVLGIDPTQQGKGLGGALLQPVLERAENAGLPCYLETQNEANLDFYQKHGFDVVSDGVTPKGDLRVWAMVRQPKTHASK